MNQSYHLYLRTTFTTWSEKLLKILEVDATSVRNLEVLAQRH